MCEFCAKHKRKKWFLDKENFKEKMLRDKKRQTVLKKLSGYGMDYYMRDSSDVMKWLEVPLVGKIASMVLGRMAVIEHSGQVVTVDDAVEIVKLADNHVCFECICRKMVGQKNVMTCINFGPMRDLCKFANPKEKMEEIDTKEAIYRIKESHKKGFVSEVLYATAPFPIALCSCERNYCLPFKDRFLYNFPLAYIKGHEVAVIEPKKCKGCSQHCMSRCQFGAMYFDISNFKVVIDVTKCFGCGLCVSKCPTNAISLINRQTVPGAKNKW